MGGHASEALHNGWTVEMSTKWCDGETRLDVSGEEERHESQLVCCECSETTVARHDSKVIAFLNK